MSMMRIGEPVKREEDFRLLRGRGCAVSRHRKPTMTRPAVAEVVNEIAGTCDAAVIALAD